MWIIITSTVLVPTSELGGCPSCDDENDSSASARSSSPPPSAPPAPPPCVRRLVPLPLGPALVPMPPLTAFLTRSSSPSGSVSSRHTGPPSSEICQYAIAA